MTAQTRFSAVVIAAAATFAVAARADAPHVYAIKGARIVTAAAAPIASGTIVIRNGVIDAVGADAAAPADAMVIDGAGLTVYPGLIDMGTAPPTDTPAPVAPNFRTTEEAERWKRSQIFQPDYDAASHVRADAPELSRLASAGVTSVLALPAGTVVRGQSALVNVAGPVDEPQIGNVGDYRRGLTVVRTPVALHVDFGGRTTGPGYPVSLLGTIALVRQGFLDAQHQQLAAERYAKSATAAGRPTYDPALDALQPALAGKLPVAFEADAEREIVRALNMAKEFKLTPMITGGREADRVAADLKSANARVIYSLNFPTRSRALAPDADEPIAALRTRAQAPKVPAALEKAGVLFAFASSGLREERDFVRNAARAVKEGLPADAAVKALTINAAKIAGADQRVGSLEKGKIANVLVTDGDLFEERTAVKHVFVDGRLVDLEQSAPPAGRGGRGRGGI